MLSAGTCGPSLVGELRSRKPLGAAGKAKTQTKQVYQTLAFSCPMHLPPASISITVLYLEHFPILLWSHLHWTNSYLSDLIKYTRASRLPAAWGFQCIFPTPLSTQKLLHRLGFLWKTKTGLCSRLQIQHILKMFLNRSLWIRTLPLIKEMTHMQKHVKWIWNGMDLSKLQEIVKDRVAWSAAIHGVAVRHDWVTEQQ